MHVDEIHRIAAFIPGDKEGLGRCVQVFFREGTTGCIDLGLQSFIRRLANTFALNLIEARRRFGAITGQKNLVPLVLTPFLLYVPIKSRNPLISGDPAYGYFRLRSVIEVSETPGPCTLRLEGAQSITVRQSYRTVCRRLRTARKLESLLVDRYWQDMDALRTAGCTHQIYKPFSMQENMHFYGISDVERMKEVGCMELRNLMEELVYQRLNEVLAAEKTEACNCEQCRLDMAALALNDLPPRYVVTQRGATYSKADILEIQRYVDVVAAVTKAVKVVQQKPGQNCKR
ncbi:MAG: late competence development ComFB family protein [Bacillota bacterium]|nr:late competence development ComFB family protein [Bacillota bacterium]MDW7683372.1 late competence development ComFB family protein [Bacillota bacterium]